MTAGGDTDELDDEATLDEADDVGDETGDIDLNENDPDPTAGASDIGGRAGELDPLAAIDDDGQPGSGQGPTDR
ncbi:MAG: hypothetical protein QOF71_1644 [Candidatus Eremiobacteraeota bacterium]|jgi:hypothetical protein|nr:hypothetical protein [Candidatus Eremiobacteraeota bacterium]